MSVAEDVNPKTLMRSIKKMIELYCMPHELDVTFADKTVDEPQAKTTVNGVIDLFINNFRDVSIHTLWDDKYKAIYSSSAEKDYAVHLTTDQYVTIVSYTVFQYLLKHNSQHPQAPSVEHVVARLSNIMDRLQF